MTVVFFTHSLMFWVFLVFLDMKHLMDRTLDSPQGELFTGSQTSSKHLPHLYTAP